MTDVLASLTAATDAATLRRGTALARAHGVIGHGRAADVADGTVRGATGSYHVEVRVDADGVTGRCECIAQMTAPVCKHMVALALVAWAAQTPAGPSVRDLVDALPAGRAAALLADVAERDPDVRVRIETLVAAATGAVDVKAVRSAITAATTAPRDPSWRAVRDVADRAGRAVDLVRGLVDARDPSAPALAEHLISRVDRLLGRVDDSGGHLVAVHEAVRTLHLQACTAVPRTPAELAAALVRIACTTEWDWVHDAPERYHEVLGAAGGAALDTAVARARARQPPPRVIGTWTGETHVATTLRLMAESSARASGDVDRLVRVLGEDLSHPRRYVTVARALEMAGREREAHMWLTRGVAAHGTADPTLRTALVTAHLRDGLVEDAVDLLRAHLVEHPTAAAFAELRRACPPGGWDALRPWALARVAAAGADEHVLALLADGDLPSALHVAEAPVRSSTHLVLARAAARTDVDAALRHYAPLLDEHLRGTGRGPYRQACAVLTEMHAVASVHGQAERVEDLARRIRATHIRRPALVEMLDALGW